VKRISSRAHDDVLTRLLVHLFAALALTGCAAVRHSIDIPDKTSARPEAPVASATPSGGIFQAAGYRPLFEDRKPRYVGDILTIQINERLNASQTANSNTERKTSVEAGIPGVSGLLGNVIKPIKPLSVEAEVGTNFDGKGSTTSTNLFTGSITVTVLEVLANGNLRVAGEKQIGIRQNSEVLKFSGVINPTQIQPGNVVSSTQVADARLDYRGGGGIEAAQVEGWLTRFFNAVSPF
jgi:flagellar L-ring protein FlgH